MAKVMLPVMVSSSLSSHALAQSRTVQGLHNRSTQTTNICMGSVTPSSSSSLKPVPFCMQHCHGDKEYLPPKVDADNLKSCMHGLPKTFQVQKSEPVLIRPTKETYNGDYYLSNGDQNLVLPMEALFSFKTGGKKSSDNVYEVIKKGLAQVLVDFYPLAGRLAMGPDGKFMVNCTGEGVYFVEAFLECDMDEFGDINPPNPAKLRQLVYLREAKNHIDMPLLTVQVTKFKCGGFVLGLFINHCMMDGASAFMFIKCWAESARGLPLSVPPFLDRTILKVPKLSPSEVQHLSMKYNCVLTNKDDVSSATSIIPQEEEMVEKLIEFNNEKLMHLKRIVIEEGITRIPTNFEVLTAFMWRALRRSNTRPQPNKVLIPVNARIILRKIPKAYFGTCLGYAFHVCNTEELIEMPLSFAVKQVQEAIQMVTTINLQSFAQLIETMGVGVSFEDAFVFSNMCRFPSHQVDFGWGEPNDFGFTTMPRDFIFFLPQKERNKMVAVLGLPPSSMKIFQELIELN